MKKNSIVIGVVLVLVFLSIFLSIRTEAAEGVRSTPTPKSNQPKVIKWLGQQTYGPFLPGKQWADWAKKLQILTGGRLIIEWKDAPSIVPVAESFEAVRRGVLNLVSTHPLAYVGGCPIAYASMGFPCDFDNQQEKFDYFYNRGAYQLLQPVYEKEYNVHWFPQPMAGDRRLFNSFYANKAEDMKGKKVRGGPQDEGILKAIGATLVQIPAPEVYNALKLGTIDSAIWGDFGLDIFYGVAKSVVFYPGMGTDTGSLLINYDSWKALPADIRDIVETATPALIADFSMKENINFTTVIWMKAAKKYGFKVIHWSEDDAKKVRKGADSYLDKIAKTHPLNAKCVEIFKQQQRELGKL